jgi:hypothetical protein
MSFLQIAKDKFNGSKFITHTKDFKEFVSECYVKLPPCSYGSRIAERIRFLLEANYVPSIQGRGDFEYNGLYYEQKVSFLSSLSDKWSITHIRPWQKFSYFSFCFIDCSNDFKPHFYVIPRNSIHQFKLTAMNGTEKANMDNSIIELRTDIKKDSHSHLLLHLDYNLLRDEEGNVSTSFESFKRFVHSKK